MRKLSVLLSCILTASVLTAAPLRVFVRGGAKSHGPEGNGVHEHARFVGEATQLLTERGIDATGGREFPTAEQLAKTDVLVMYAQEGGHIPEDKRPGLEAFLKRGGGVVLIHTASVPENKPGSAEYLKKIVGGTWIWNQTKWLEGPMSLYYVDRTHPLTKGLGNFDVDDEIYYDMDLDPEAQVLAAVYTPNLRGSSKTDPRGVPPGNRVTVYDIAPQIWAYENTLDGGKPYRAVVSIPGHNFETFELPHYRAFLLRAIAWTGHRENTDEFCVQEELDSLLYPEGGASRPADSLAQMNIHPDFELKLVATEPLINNPMNVNWDPQGRLWVAETPEYPDGRYANDKSDLVQRWIPDAKNQYDGRFDRPAHDKVSILSDTNGDGVMDKKQIFHDGLELVTSLVFYRDGVIVSQSPEILWLRDTNGDGKADKVETLYKNLGNRDTHAVLNNLRWGFDGWIYGTHGYSSSQHVMSGDGKTDFGNIGSGVIRFRPDGSKIEQYSSKGGNTWGLQITWDNEVLWTQPTSGDLLMHSVLSENVLSKGRLPGTPSYNVVIKSPKSYSAIPYEQLPYVQIDWVGSFTAAAGTVLYDGGAWPSEWNFNYLTTEPTINIVHHEIIEPNGVSYTGHKAAGREETEFITGKDYWFRPIEVRTGPDGAVYLIDFYNQAAIHNDTRGPKHGPRNAAIRPDRDHYYGRIYRLDHKQAKDVPPVNLTDASPTTLVKALETPNRHVRMDAVRLLVENGAAEAVTPLKQLAESDRSPEARVAALWTLARMNRIPSSTLQLAAADSNASIRKTALMIAADYPEQASGARKEIVKRLNDSNARVRLEALEALAAAKVTADEAAVLVSVFPKLEDNWSRSAFLAAAVTSPAEVMNAALASSSVNNELIGLLTGVLVNSNDAGEISKLVVSLASRPDSQNQAKQIALEALAAGLKSDLRPTWSPDLQNALKKLIASSDPGVSATALPLAVRWDQNGSLTNDVANQIEILIARLKDRSVDDAQRTQLTTALLGVRSVNAGIVPAVGSLLGGKDHLALQLSVLDALGNIPDTEAAARIIAAFPGLDVSLQTPALNQLLRRAAWSMALLDSLENGGIDPQVLGPANIHRLRLHADAAVSKRANAVIDKLRGPEAKEKAELIAQLVPEVQTPGDVANGKMLFTTACATCHQFNGVGNLVGPALTGMGAHGAAELLVHIIDPNREVDFAFYAVSVETKDGEIYDGVISRENRSMVALRNAAGETEIQKSDIASRRNTGRSLMPEGFESLGAEGLRDLLAYVTADSQSFRILDLRELFNGSSTGGIYGSRDDKFGTVKLKKFGTIEYKGIPFDVISPQRNSGGRNLLTLKGTLGIAPEYVQTVEIPVNAEANRIHFLSGVGAWAWPYDAARIGKKPVVKVTVHYADGSTEELVFKNGVEYADYINNSEVSGSTAVPDLVNGGQIRYFSKNLKKTARVDRITLASFNNEVAPTFVGITVENAEPGSVAPDAAKAAAPVGEWGPGIKSLLIGGGASHDYDKWFKDYDSKLLKDTGKYAPRYFEPQDLNVDLVKSADVILISANKAFPDPAVRQAIFDHVNAGKGLILLHPGLWYNWSDWPEFNKELAGGGSRGHNRFGEFEVKVIKPDHPLMKGVPAEFNISDELYYYTPDPEGTPIEVLATAYSEPKKQTFPQVFVVRHPKSRIVGLTLGHDEKAHSHPAYQQLLFNAFDWISKPKSE